MSHDAHTPTGRVPGGPPPHQQLDAYLDGLLVGAELAEFEAALASDPALRDAVEAQEQIDRSLSRLFHRADPVPLPDAPEAAPFILPATTPTRAAAAPWLSRHRWLAAAALLVIAVSGALIARTVNRSEWMAEYRGLVNAADVYERKVSTGFSPDWVCKDDAEFLENTRELLGEEFLVASTGDVKVVGWSYYEPVMSKDTILLLTRVECREVLLVMDRKSKDRRFNLPEDSGLRDFQRVVGDVVIHEITPFEHPRVLPLVARR